MRSPRPICLVELCQFGNAPFHDAGHEQQSASIEEIQAKSENNLAHYARQMLSRISHSQSECNPLGFTKSLTLANFIEARKMMSMISTRQITE
jgi:hypothetical protein